MAVVAINPNTENPELCQSYPDFAAENISNSDKIMPVPDYDTLERPDDYEAAVQSGQKKTDRLEAELENSAEDTDVEGLKTEPEKARTSLKNIEGNDRVVTPEEIEIYRSYADKICVSVPMAISDDDLSVIQETISRFEEGEIDAGAFIGDMDRRLRMDAQENG